MVIWKFELRIAMGEQRVVMPAGATLLSIQSQHGAPVLWALCDESAPSRSRRLWAYATGDAMLKAWPYIATLQIESNVIHYFDLGEID